MSEQPKEDKAAPEKVVPVTGTIEVVTSVTRMTMGTRLTIQTLTFKDGRLVEVGHPQERYT